jgi:hypothetical protein
MPPLVARIHEGEAVREQQNKYGPGITPAWDTHGNVVTISFSGDFTRELAEDWLNKQGYAGAVIEQNEPVKRTLSFGISDVSGRMERNGNALTVKGVRLLAEGVWTDSMQKTPWRVKPEVLQRQATNWTDNTIWNRHAGGQHRAVTDKVGSVQNLRYENGAAVGDVHLHGLTQNSRDAAALVEAGEINYVSVETLGKDKWNVGTKEFEAQDITFTGLALVNKGACTVCTLRENEAPPEPIAEPEAPEPIEEDEGMTLEEIAALKADIKKELSDVYDGRIKELSDKLAASEKKVKELSEAEAEIKTKASDSTVRDLAPPAGYRVIIDSQGEVYEAEA